MANGLGTLVHSIPDTATRKSVLALGLKVDSLDKTLSTIRRNNQNTLPHSDLTELDFASSGHTGFASSAALSAHMSNTSNPHTVTLQQAIAAGATATSEPTFNGGIDLGTLGRIDSNVPDGANVTQFLIKPTTALTSTTADARAHFVVQNSVGDYKLAVYGNGMVEFGGSSAYLADAMMGVRASTTKSLGMYFAPSGMSSSGGSYGGLSGACGGVYATAGPPGSTAPAATAYAAGIFDGPVLTSITSGTPELHGVVIRPRASATGTTATFPALYGLRVMTSPGGKNAGTYTNTYQIHVADAFASGAAAGFSPTNVYGLYIEKQTRGVTINNGIYIGGASAGWKSIALGSQAEYISAAGSGYIGIVAGTGITYTIGATDQITVLSQMLQVNVDTFDFQLPTGTGTKLGTSSSEKLGLWGVAPVVQPGPFTQTYSTASHTHANLTATSVSTTAATNTAPYGYTTQAQADAIPVAINALLADLTNLKQVVNAIVDDGQLMGAWS